MNRPTLLTGLPVRRLLATTGLALALAAPAQAALVQGDWDPPFGAPFPQLGWRGTATIDVPLACLSLSDFVVNDTLSCPLMTVVNASVEFYDLGDPSPTPATVETLDFGAFVAVGGIFVNAGQVEGFELNSTGLVASTSPLAVTVPGGAQALFGLDITFDLEFGTLAVLNWYEAVGNPAGGRNDPAFPAVVEISQFDGSVPVPATLALALAGLGLMAGLQRRR